MKKLSFRLVYKCECVDCKKTFTTNALGQNCSYCGSCNTQLLEKAVEIDPEALVPNKEAEEEYLRDQTREFVRTMVLDGLIPDENKLSQSVLFGAAPLAADDFRFIAYLMNDETYKNLLQQCEEDKKKLFEYEKKGMQVEQLEYLISTACPHNEELTAFEKNASGNTIIRNRYPKLTLFANWL